MKDLEVWLDNNTTYYDVQPDGPEVCTAGPNIPVLAAVCKRIWYHATDDITSYPFSAVVQTALKREPNAAAQAPLSVKTGSDAEADSRQVESATSACAKPAPAAHVAEALTAISKAEEVVFNAAIVADDRMRYEEAKNHRKLSEALKQAAALLAKLGQGWVPVSERLPKQGSTVLVFIKEDWLNIDDSWNIADIANQNDDERGFFIRGTFWEWKYASHWMPLPPAPGASDE